MEQSLSIAVLNYVTATLDVYHNIVVKDVEDFLSSIYGNINNIHYMVTEGELNINNINWI